MNNKVMRIVQQNDMETAFNEKPTKVSNSFIDFIVENNLNFAQNGNITLNGENRQISDNDIAGMIIKDSIINPSSYADVKKAMSVNMDGVNSVNIRDDGPVYAFAKDMSMTNFYNMENDYNLSINGEAELLGVSSWDTVWGVAKNLFTFDFSSVSQFFTNTVSNPNIMFNGDTFESASLNVIETTQSEVSNQDEFVTVQVRPTLNISNRFDYDNNEYWYFATLQGKPNKNTCQIVSSYNMDIGEYTPMSICGKNIGMAFTPTQYKLSGE
jgi:hypothetical protein